MRITGIDAVVFGVTDVPLAKRFLGDWGLVADQDDDACFLTRDHTQIVVHDSVADDLPPAIDVGSTVREVVWGVACPSDLDEITTALAGDVLVSDDGTIRTTDPMGLAISFRLTQRRSVEDVRTQTNAPGATARVDKRAPFYTRAAPYEVSHVVFGASDLSVVEDFYVGRLGFLVSDRYRGRAVFLRAAPNGNHHHLFVLNSADSRPHFNHVAFKVRDIHEVIGGGQHIVSRGWESQAGPGRHYLSSACFWYFHSPLGGAFEYAADEDIVSEAWQPGEYEMSPDIFTEWKFNLGTDVGSSMPIAASRPT